MQTISPYTLLPQILVDQAESSTLTKQSGDGQGQLTTSCLTSLRNLDSLKYETCSVRWLGSRLCRGHSEEGQAASEGACPHGEVRMPAGCLTRASVQDR